MRSDPEQSAREVLETLPLVLRVIRGEVRRARFPNFSLPQFRALAYLGRNPGAMLSDVNAFEQFSCPVSGWNRAKQIGNQQYYQAIA